MIQFELDGLTRRKALLALASGVAALVSPRPLLAAPDSGFARWVANFKARAVARGISEKTYDRVMSAVKPDMGVFALQRAQPEFTEQLWQYLNRRCSEWRLTSGKQARRECPAAAKLEKDFGVALDPARALGHGDGVRRRMLSRTTFGR